MKISTHRKAFWSAVAKEFKAKFNGQADPSSSGVIVYLDREILFRLYVDPDAYQTYFHVLSSGMKQLARLPQSHYGIKELAKEMDSWTKKLSAGGKYASVPSKYVR